MALAEATVRVILDISKFERDLLTKTRAAADKAGREFDQKMNASLGKTGTKAAKSFSSSVGPAMGQAGSKAGRDFSDNLTQAVGKSGARVTKELTKGTSEGARSAGRRAGREFSVSFGVGTARAGRPLVALFVGLGAAVTESLRPALGIFAAFPPLVSALVASVGITVAAFKGMGDALKAVNSEDIEKMRESMSRLAPAAQSVVREFQAARPALAALRSDIQQAFFGQLTGQFTALTGALSGPLRASIISVGAATGQLTSRFVEVFTSARGVSNLNGLFRGTGDFVRSLAPGLANLTKGFLDFVGAAAPGLNDVGRALTTLLTRMGQFLSGSANSGKALAWVEGGIDGLRRLSATLADIGRIFLTIAQAVRPLAFALAGIADLVAGLARAFSTLPGPIQTAVAAALILSRLGLADFFKRTAAAATGQNGVLTQMGSAYRSTATAVGDFVRHQTNAMLLTSSFGGSLTATGTAVRGLGAHFGTLAGAAAGAGAAVTKGMTGALKGLVNFMGGPIGIAFAGLGVLLAILAGNQQKAAQAAAEHKAHIASLADTLDRQTGAVTQATRALVAKELAEKGLITTGTKLGISADTLVSASLGQADALGQVNTALLNAGRSGAKSTTEFDKTTAALQSVGVSGIDLGRALSGDMDSLFLVGVRAHEAGISLSGLAQKNNDAIKPAAGLAGAVGLLNIDLKTAAAQVAAAGSAMSPAALQAQKLADAMAILASNTSTADQKAKALLDVLNQLAGGTVNAEVAQGRFTQILDGVNEKMKAVTEKTQGFGKALLDSNGRINTQTTAGATLIGVYEEISSGLATASAATLEAGRATGNLDAAYQKIALQTQAARVKFIEAAIAAGLTAEAAGLLATKMGLLPRDVSIAVGAPGAQQVMAELITVRGLVQAVPPGKSITLTTLSAEAERKLIDFGFKVTHLPNGEVKVDANTNPARGELDNFIARNNNRTVTVRVITEVREKVVGGFAPGAKGHVLQPMAAGGFSSMSGSVARIVPPQTFRLIGDRMSGDEAFIPINSSSRSAAILDLTARRMGKQVIPAGSASNTLSIGAGAIVINAPFADPALVARAAVNEIARLAAS